MMNAPQLNTENMARWANGRAIGANVEVTSAIIDSRNVQKGQLFVALKGENTDGHAFAEKALENGASALLVDHELPLNVAQVIVDDVGIALAQIATAWLQACREYHPVRVVALTGSCGKTVSKEMLAAILRECGDVAATQGNLNNHLGVPLTVLSLKPAVQQLVVEMGASGPNEIAFLCEIAHPDIGLITNAGNAHLEGFGSEEGIARAKGEMYASLSDKGAAIINLDSEWAAQWQQTAAHTHQYTFGLNSAADFTVVPGTVSQILGADRCTTRFTMRTPIGEVDITMPVAGEHNICNALAVSAAAMAAGADLSDIRLGLAKHLAVTGRMTIQKITEGRLKGLHVVDDAYNANPGSVKAAINWVAKVADHGVLVLGEMAELGETSLQLHQDIGRYAAEKGIDVLWTLGEKDAQAMATGYGPDAHYRADFDELLNDLVPTLENADVVLVKGSLSKGTRRVVQALMGFEGI